jgi:hypothetical protein
MKLKTKITIKPEDLLTIAQTHQKLGKGFSRKSIMRRIESGDWAEGVHYIDDARSDSRLRSIKINITAVQEWRSTPAAKR